MATDILHFTMCNVYIVCNVKFIKSGEKGIITFVHLKLLCFSHKVWNPLLAFADKYGSCKGHAPLACSPKCCSNELEKKFKKANLCMTHLLPTPVQITKSGYICRATRIIGIIQTWLIVFSLLASGMITPWFLAPFKIKDFIIWQTQS